MPLFPVEDHAPAEFLTLLHELRQPLSTIETCAYLLQIMLEETGDPRVRENLETIGRQVAEIDRLLLTAGRKPVQRAGGETAASLSLTNAASAALT